MGMIRGQQREVQTRAGKWSRQEFLGSAHHHDRVHHDESEGGACHSLLRLISQLMAYAPLRTTLIDEVNQLSVPHCPH